MMNRSFLKKVCLTAAFFIFMGATLSAAVPEAGTAAEQTKSRASKTVTKKNTVTKKMNTFNNPDFAFPQTVSDNASVELDKALKISDGVTALRAAMQIAVSRDLISTDNYKEGIALFSRLGNELQAPYSSLAKLLEAQFYKDIYQSDPWTFRNRTLPTEPVPENVMEWSGKMFADRVSALVENAFDNIKAAREVPVDSIKSIIRVDTETWKVGMTVYDFMVLKAMDILAPFGDEDGGTIIPFGAGASSTAASLSTRDRMMSLLDADIEWNESKGNQSLASILSFIKYEHLNSDRKKDYLSKCIEKYIDTPDCASFLYSERNYIDSEEEQEVEEGIAERNRRVKSYYSKVSGYLKKFPDCRNATALRSVVSSLEAKSLNVACPGKFLPGRDGKGVVEASNIFSFNLLVVKVPGNPESVKLAGLGKSGRVMQSIPMRFKGETPERFDSVFSIAPLQQGTYAVVASRDNTLGGLITGIYPRESVETFLVSGLSYFTLKDEGKDTARLFVVEGASQKPVKNAKITFEPVNGRGNAFSRVSGEDGSVEIPAGSYSFGIRSGKDYAKGNIWNSRGYSDDISEVKGGNLFTDLSIYKPGEKVRFLGILYSEKERRFSAAKRTSIVAELIDANNQRVDSLRLMSDDFGRVSGTFTIPETGLLGNYRVSLGRICSSYFTVADYKAPTFYVAVSGIEPKYSVGDTVRIKGKVMTYSGMPVGGAAVKFNVKYMPWRWLFYSSVRNATYGGELKAGQDGSFEIALPTAGLRDTPYMSGTYQLEIAATNPGGETQQAPSEWFSLGEAYSIASSVPALICRDKAKQTFGVRVMDMFDKPVVKKVYYRIYDFNKDSDDKSKVKALASGEFESPTFTFDMSGLSSGRYTLEFSLNRDFKANKESANDSNTIILYSDSDKEPPVETSVWIPKTQIVAEPNDKTVKIRFGCSYPGDWIYVNVSDCGKEISGQWIKMEEKLTEFEVNVPALNDRVYVTFAGMHDLASEQKRVTVIPSSQLEKIKITVSSFRDRITPGAKEKWVFNFAINDRSLAGIPVAAVMSNKALDALAPFNWSFNPQGNIYYRERVNLRYAGFGQTIWSMSLSKVNYRGLSSFVNPDWNLYGYNLYGGRFFGRKYKIMRSMSAPMVMEESAVYAEEEVADEVTGESPLMAYASNALKGKVSGVALDEKSTDGIVETATGGTDGGEGRETAIRDIECPIAFFMPDLITDPEGNALVDFTVPQFNGTWKFQILGYTPEMLGAVSQFEATASKPVMVSMNVPRFLLMDDRTLIMATIYNNSDKATALGGKIEIFDPVTGEILKTMEFPGENVAASASRTISMEYGIGTPTNYIGLRAYGFNNEFSDGEQTVIPILPNTTPVVESKPFYLEPGAREFEMKLPSFGKEGNVTLQYSDNPIWECVTALPDISEAKSSNVLSQIYSLYGNAIGAGLAKDYPEIPEAIRIFADPANSKDSTLVSNLEKDGNLKTVALTNTPWVQSAASETLRMQSLVKYADAARSETIIASTLDNIGKLQNPDGGWSWCDGMKSSEFITSRVLLHFAMLNGMGYLPGNALRMAERGIDYADRSWVKDLEEYRGSKFPYISMLNYLYVRSFFKGVKMSSKFAAMNKKALKEIVKGWRDMGIYEKATAATLLARQGYPMEARTILESLRQYASVSAEKGMWFDNLSSSAWGWNKLITTAQVLEAYSEILPQSKEIDKLRQWFVITKQTENWGDDRETAEVIHAVLTSGTKWTVPSSPAKITIAGEEIIPDRVAQLTGSLTVSISTKSKGMLRIERDGSGPAWGGVISQYVAPIKDVKAAGIPQLSIEKNVYVITEGKDGSKASASALKTGDKVRVTLTLTCDRDLEYVAVTDGRSACLEPADQTSGYMASDGVWMYREVRNESTNLFIPFLKKGTSVISYDCYVDRSGVYSLGIATTQSQYAPEITAHSAGKVVTVSRGE